MSWVAVAIVGSAVVGGVIASEASRSAANTQADAARYAGDLQAAATFEGIEESKRQYDLGRADYEKYYKQARDDAAPWREAGTWGVNELARLLQAGPGEFTEDPGYQFRLGEGTKALNRGAAARGKYFSTDTMKALEEYGQDYASGEYTNFLNRYYQKLNPLQSLAGMGQTGTMSTSGWTGPNVNNANELARIYQTGAQGMGNAAMLGANAQAANAINQANIWTGAANTGINNYLAYKYYNPANTLNYAGYSGVGTRGVSPGNPNYH